jgi:hypothetical protein
MDTLDAFLILKRAATLGFVVAVAAIAVLPATVEAQPAPSYAQPAPSYAQPYRQDLIRGTVYSINGKYNITVRDNRGFLDNVSLHNGTIINPRGWRLEPGNPVTISGKPSGRTFIADEIDTPYFPYPRYYRYPPPYYRLGVRAGW